MHKTKIGIILALLSILIAAYVISSIQKNTNPHVGSNGQYIPFTYKATLKNLETGTLFEYTEKDGVLETCRATHCNYIYFFADWDGKIEQPSLDNANNASIYGKVVGVKVHNKNSTQQSYLEKNTPLEADYLISYAFNGKLYQSPYAYDLCVQWKGGDVSCNPPAKIGDPIKVSVNSDGNTITYATFTNTIKAEVLTLEQVK
jgi:hypothetical protein